MSYYDCDPNKPKRPIPPSEWEYKSRVDRIYIYEFIESLREDDDEDYDEDDELPKKSCPELEKVNLAWILKNLPEGISPEQVKIECGYSASSMAYENHYMKIYYEKKIPAREEEYKIAKAKYEKELVQHELDIKKYEADKRAEKIKSLQAELANLQEKT